MKKYEQLSPDCKEELKSYLRLDKFKTVEEIVNMLTERAYPGR